MNWNALAVEDAALLLLDHRARGAALPVPPPAERLAEMGRGYAIQAALDRRLRAGGARQIGWKIAGTNAASRRHLKIEAPFYGRLYDTLASASPAVLPAHPGYFRVHEPEVALHLARDLPPQEAPFDAAALRAATAALLPALEIIGTWQEPWAEAGAPALAADNAAHGWWVFGTAVTDWSAFDVLDTPVTLTIDGVPQATGTGRNVDGGPFGAAAWLANALAETGQGLRAGDHVTTGTLTPPVPVRPGQAVLCDFGPLGSVRAAIAAR